MICTTCTPDQTLFGRSNMEGSGRACIEDKGNAYMVLMGKPEATTSNTYV